MSIPLRKEIELSASELSKLAAFSKQIGLPQRYVAKLIKDLGKLELMVLDAAMKELDLVKLRNTILVLEEPYLFMLQKVTISLLQVLKQYILTTNHK